MSRQRLGRCVWSEADLCAQQCRNDKSCHRPRTQVRVRGNGCRLECRDSNWRLRRVERNDPNWKRTLCICEFEKVRGGVSRLARTVPVWPFGFEVADAFLLAASRVDLQVARTLADTGCSPPLALRILL